MRVTVGTSRMRTRRRAIAVGGTEIEAHGLGATGEQARHRGSKPLHLHTSPLPLRDGPNHHPQPSLTVPLSRRAAHVNSSNPVGNGARPRSPRLTSWSATPPPVRARRRGRKGRDRTRVRLHRPGGGPPTAPTPP